MNRVEVYTGYRSWLDDRYRVQGHTIDSSVEYQIVQDRLVTDRQ